MISWQTDANVCPNFGEADFLPLRGVSALSPNRTAVSSGGEELRAKGFQVRDEIE